MTPCLPQHNNECSQHLGPKADTRWSEMMMARSQWQASHESGNRELC